MTINKKEEKPLVSVCIPAYNNADYIEETMDTVIKQTYSNIELIVVDDGSKDDTWSVINLYKEKYDSSHKDDPYRRKIRLYKNEHNLGMAGNWNRALSLCEGKYLKLICADDLLDKNLTQREVDILEEYPEVNCVSSDTQFIDLNGNRKGLYKRYHKNGVIEGRDAVKYSVFTRDYLGAPLANLFRKSVYDEVGGFDETLSFIIDYEFFMKIYCAGKVYIMHEAMNYFRVRNDSNTGQVLGGTKGHIYIAEHRQLMKKYAPILGLNALQVGLSVQIRKLMNFLGSIYLQMMLPKEN